MTFKQFMTDIKQSSAEKLVFDVTERCKESGKIVNPIRYHSFYNVKQMRDNNDYKILEQFNDCEVYWSRRNDWCISASLERLI